MTAAETVLRADAQRNLARILEAAREVFAERGADASIAEVAARAGVGTATIFRRFPTKDDLLVAVVERRLGELSARAAQAAAARDPARALRRFMEWAAHAYIGDRGFCECAESSVRARPSILALAGELSDNVERLLDRAKAAGEVREDVTAQDIPVLLLGVAHAGLALEHEAPGLWRRYLDLTLDGLRPEGARPLSRRPPSRRQLAAARTRGRPQGEAARPGAPCDSRLEETE